MGPRCILLLILDTAGVDGQPINDCKACPGDHLYEIWNRMLSGSYFSHGAKKLSETQDGEDELSFDERTKLK